MSTFTAYLDDQDLIRIQKGEEHILPFYLKQNQGRLALIPCQNVKVERLIQETIS